MNRRTLIGLLAFMFLLSYTTISLAQTDTARLQGTITDAQGAVVNGATITVTSLGTGRSVTVESGGAGDYSVPALPPGHYKVEVKMQGFKAVTQEITLQVSQIAPVNFQLQPGDITTSVEVTADVPLVESASSTISDVVVGRQVTELPLNGRNFTQLATLVPGVTRGVIDGDASGGRGNSETFRFSNVGGASLSVNGLRPQANNFILDGIDNNESLVNTIIFFPPAEAIEEFRVDTSIAPAEFGRAGGGVVSTSIKSGTNSLHGTVFEFLRNDNLDATRTFIRATCPPGKDCKSEFRRNQFGGTIGGPIIKDKVFFFFDYQGLRQLFPLGLDRATVPTPKMRNGDFSELLSGPNPILIKDPLLSGPCVSNDPRQQSGCFSGNIIPPNRINPVAQKYLNAYPLPNAPGVLQNFLVTRNQTQHFNDFDARVDWILGTRDSMFGRFSFGQDSSVTSSRLPALPAGFGSGTNPSNPRGLALNETHTFSNSLVNEFRFGYIRTRYGFTPPFQDQQISANLGIPNANTSPLLGGGALIGGFNNQIEFTGDFGPFLVPQNSFQYSDTLSWVKGAHNLKFGASIIRRQVNLFRPNRGKGFFVLFGDGGGSSPTHYEVSDLLAGFVQQYDIGPPFGMVGTRNWETGYFVQDDWKVSHRLTLNLGLRYDLYTWPVEVADRQANFDITTGKLLLAGQGGASRSFVPTDKNNFAPRFGFAYDLTGHGKTVLRGGYGIFYFVDRGGIDNQLAQNPPFSGFSSFSYNNGFRMTLSGQAPLNSNDSRLATGPLPQGNVNNVNLNNPQNVTVFEALPSNRNSYVQEWNLQIQRELGANTALSVGYVGTKGTRLTTYYNFNRQFYNAPPGTSNFPSLGGNVNVQDTIGNSIYHALQTRLEHRFTAGWQFTMAYTWAHAIDDSPGAFDQGNGNAVDFNNLRLERGNSSLDVRQRFTFSTLYELPFGRGKTYGHDWSGAVEALLGGWQLNGILTFQSGLPFDLTAQGTPNTHPDQIREPNNQFTTGQYFDVSAFQIPPTNQVTNIRLRAGNVARNLLTGPGTSNLDLSIFKNFKFKERYVTQFRAQFYNFTNTPQFAQPNGDITNVGQRGQILDTRLSSERQIEFAIRFSF
ncbi:MAG: TonB-dependent receptor [Acidobacteriia bacterium]|nr:TonB-dependent receptor [Terriglobia bacterium]